MEATKARLRSTPLLDRTLWFDGDSSFDPARVDELIRSYSIKYVDHLTPDIKTYNKFVSPANAIVQKDKCNKISNAWNIPPEYANLDVVAYVFDKHHEEFSDRPDFHQRERRLAEELVLFEKRRFFDVLRAIIYIINTLNAHNVVWGVGRGSSVSSYVLYVIGTHDVDSVEYELDIRDFLH